MDALERMKKEAEENLKAINFFIGYHENETKIQADDILENAITLAVKEANEEEAERLKRRRLIASPEPAPAPAAPVTLIGRALGYRDPAPSAGGGTI